MNVKTPSSTNRILLIALFAMAMVASFGCGPKEEGEENSEEARGSVRVVGGGGGGTLSPTIDIPILMQTSSRIDSSFGLVSNPDYTIDLADCISGYSFSATEANPVMKVYKFDRNCKAKLTEIIIGGRTLIPTSTTPFTTWDAGDTAVFDEVDEAGVYAVHVTVISQLANPIAGTETIEYQIKDLIEAGDFDANVPAISLAGVTCCATNTLKANAIELTLTWSPLTSPYDHVILRRASGATPPAALDCTSDTLVNNFTTFVSGDIVTYTDDTGKPGQNYSYRACVFDSGSQVIETATLSNVTSANIQWMFVTSTSFSTGGFGTASAVTNCQTLGNTIDSTLEWTALLSDTSMEAAGRIPISGNIYNRAAVPELVTSSYSSFWNGALTVAGRYDETGGASTSSAWTGTILGGNRSTTNCLDWTDGTNASSGTRGTANSTSLYLDAGTTACNSGTRTTFCLSKAVKPLSVFSVATPGSGTDGDVAVTVTMPADTTGWTKLDIRRNLGATDPDSTCTTGTLVKSYTGPTFTSEVYTDATGKAGAYYRYVACLYKGAGIVAKATTKLAVRAYRSTTAHTIFITSSTVNGNQAGFTNMDLTCQTAGDKLQTGKTWRAIASTSTVAANSAGRIAATTDIRNVNGDLVATSATDLFDGTITNAVRYTELGADAGTAQIWTGSTSAGAVTANQCLDWTNKNSNRNATYGIANATGSTWLSSGATTAACNSLKSFYCFSTTAD